jgi:hypothetical protein
MQRPNFHALLRSHGLRPETRKEKGDRKEIEKGDISL